MRLVDAIGRKKEYLERQSASTGAPIGNVNPDSSERCANRPFCNSPVISRPGKKYCSDRCRLDGYVLRRAKAMLDEVGAVEFNAILQRKSF
jgi:hypothetical protein